MQALRMRLATVNLTENKNVSGGDLFLPAPILEGMETFTMEGETKFG
jgi:hypothetical protein